MALPTTTTTTTVSLSIWSLLLPLVVLLGVVSAAEPIDLGAFHSTTITVVPSDKDSPSSTPSAPSSSWRFYQVVLEEHRALQFAVVLVNATVHLGNASIPVADDDDIFALASLNVYVQNRVVPSRGAFYDASRAPVALNGWAGRAARHGLAPDVVRASTRGMLVGHWDGDNVLTGDWFLGLEPVWTNATLRADRVTLHVVLLPEAGTDVCAPPPDDTGLCKSPAASVMAEPAFAGRVRAAEDEYAMMTDEIDAHDSPDGCREEALALTCASEFGECDKNGFAQRICYDSCADFVQTCLDMEDAMCNKDNAFTSYSDECRAFSSPAATDGAPKTRKWLLPVLITAGGVAFLVLLAVVYRVASRGRKPALLLNDGNDEPSSDMRYGQIEG